MFEKRVAGKVERILPSGITSHWDVHGRTRGGGVRALKDAVAMLINAPDGTQINIEVMPWVFGDDLNKAVAFMNKTVTEFGNARNGDLKIKTDDH